MHRGACGCNERVVALRAASGEGAIKVLPRAADDRSKTTARPTAMTSKIDAFSAPRPLTGVRPTVSTAPGLGSGEPVRRVSGSDQLKLTDTAVLLARLEPDVSTQPEVDLARIEALKGALAEGRYAIRPDVIADRLLGLERDLNLLGHERPGPR